MDVVVYVPRVDEILSLIHIYGGAHVDFDLSAVDGVDPEVFDSGAREQIGSFQSRCVCGSVQCSPQWNLRFDDCLLYTSICCFRMIRESIFSTAFLR